MGQLDRLLSRAARSCWAKYDRKTDGWLPLWRHMADSGLVAGLLWDRWVPRQVRALVADALPGGVEDARRLVVWSATVHDIGKATPAFACQVDGLADKMRAAGLDMPAQKRLLDRNMAPHGLAGQALLQEWLEERCGWKRRAVGQFAIAVGGHHGVPPTDGDLRALYVRPQLLRDPGAEACWRAVQAELLDACAEVSGVVARLEAWREVRLPQPVQVLLSALVIVADWIASNRDLFPYFPDAESRSEEERVQAAWKGLDLPVPWLAVEPAVESAELFASRFELPPGARIRPVQQRAVEVARAMESSGLMIVEAPMGEGKTEAALAVAEIFAARSGAGGVYLALPTMATGNAMFPRMLSWLERLPDENGGTRRSVFLAHSKAALNEEFVSLIRRGRGGASGIEQDNEWGDVWDPRADRRAASAELVAHQWLVGRKKGMLASFAAGTIDQLLFMGLKSRHLALRHLALAGKVVVIDEAHAYDTYMNSYLDRVLSWLGEYGVPVVVLSATLPARRRRELVDAYAGGGAIGSEQVEQADGYPLLTTVERGGGAQTLAVAASGRRTEVLVERLADDVELLADRLAEELADGGCVLVVRNTVDRVLETARYLRSKFGDAAVTVAHARFVDADRVDNDASLLARFGPPDKAVDRPPGSHIVVASQVAEQSLDIDFDLLVSDLCPIDLLLQRMGRLHRHLRGADQRDRPSRLRTARCLVTGADWAAVPVEPVPGSVRIYRPHALLRSAAVLDPFLDGTAPAGHAICLPEDISPLVQQAYGSQEIGPRAWREAMSQAARDEQLHGERQQEKADTFRLRETAKPGRALLGWVDAGLGDADDTRAGRAQVRDGEISLEVLVVQRREDGSIRTLPDLSKDRGGLEVPTETVPEPRIAKIVAASGLRLPYHFSYPKVLDRAIAELEAECVPAWQAKESHWLAGELILFLDENCRCRLAGFDLTYRRTDGLEVARAK